MEQYNNNTQETKTTNIYEAIDGLKSFISTFLGVIVAVVGIAVVFIVSSLEGTKEIKASNKDNAVIMGIWRESSENLFPENKVDIIKYEDKDYYFVIKRMDEEGQILDWYFAYDGGLGYIFGDYKFYILTGITIIIAVFVSQINYTTSKNGAMNNTKFLKTLKAYQDSKNNIQKQTQYIPAFCVYKNKQLYENTKREIVEGANINYEFFLSEKFDITKLEKWQVKRLNKIKKIKIEGITASHLLQERGAKVKKKTFLPISPERHQKNYLFASIIQKTFMSALSGMTVALGIVLGNWFLGITYGFTVLLSFIASNIYGADYANNGLRQRYIAKADLLNEFSNMVEYFIALDLEEKAKAKKEVVVEEKPSKEEVNTEINILEEEVLQEIAYEIVKI